MDVVAEVAQAKNADEIAEVVERWKIIQGSQTQQVLNGISMHTDAIREYTHHLQSLGFKAESLEYLRGMLDTIDAMVHETHEQLAEQKRRASLIAQRAYLNADDLSGVEDQRYIQAAARSIQEDDELIEQASEHLRSTMNA